MRSGLGDSLRYGNRQRAFFCCGRAPVFLAPHEAGFSCGRPSVVASGASASLNGRRQCSVFFNSGKQFLTPVFEAQLVLCRHRSSEGGLQRFRPRRIGSRRCPCASGLCRCVFRGVSSLDATSIAVAPRKTLRLAAGRRAASAAFARIGTASTGIAWDRFYLTTWRLLQGILPVDPQHQGGDNRTCRWLLRTSIASWPCSSASDRDHGS